MSEIHNNIPGLSPEERRILLARMLQKKSNKSKLASHNNCIHQLFEFQVSQTPDAVAVVFDNQQLTYEELNAQANQLAHHLQVLGVGPEVIVGLYIERSLEMVVGILGILKAGGAYLPLDPFSPKTRLSLILENVQPSVILTLHTLSIDLPKQKAHTVCLDSDWNNIAQQSQNNLLTKVMPDNLAYIIFSSGRGIAVEHCGISHRLDWLQLTFTLSESDTVLHQAPLEQNVAVWEIFWPLVIGGRLVIATSELQHNSGYLLNLIFKNKISIMGFVPSALSAFTDTLRLDLATKLSSLRLVLCSGEPLLRTVVEAFKRYFPCEIYNLYSLPEVVGEIAFFACHQNLTRDVLPIGYSTNKSVYVLDRNLQPVPVGVKGEIYVGGLGMARGYLQACEEAPQNFIKNPFSETTNTLLFKTGELGRRLNNGMLELSGFVNRQAWIKGFRVDIQEIEAALLIVPEVEDCRVLVRKTERYCLQLLVAYVVLSRVSALEQLECQMKSLLPEHMLPSAYVPLSNLPLTVTGEVDEETLSNLAVIDSSLVEKGERQIKLMPEVGQVAVVIEQLKESLPPLHLLDLLSVKVKNLDAPIIDVAVEKVKKVITRKKLAISYGGSIPRENAPTTLPEVLRKSAQNLQQEDTIIYIQSDGSEIVQSYVSLLEEAERILAGLKKLGLKPQDKVIFQLENNQDIISAFWGCLLGGFIPVIIEVPSTYNESNTLVTKIYQVWKLLDQPLILTNQSWQESAKEISRKSPRGNWKFGTIESLKANIRDRHYHPSNPDDLAFFNLTSGSTGLPKCVSLTHWNLISRAVGTNILCKHDRKDIILNWLPFDHIGSISDWHIRCVLLGCKLIYAPKEYVLGRPLNWLDLLDKYRITHSWAPNFAYALVNDELKRESEKPRRWDLSEVKSLLTAGEAVTSGVLDDFLSNLATYGLKKTVIRPAFGMAEMGSGITYYQNAKEDDQKFHIVDKSSLNGLIQRVSSDHPNSMKFADLGSPIPGISIRIVDDKNVTLSEDMVGNLQVKGDAVFLGYYKNLSATKEALLENNWFNTGDLGFIADGNLVVTGRAKESIIINGANYYNHELEAIIEEVEGVAVSYTAACAVRSVNDPTEKLAIFFNPSHSDDNLNIKLIKKIRQAIVSKVGVNPDYLIPVEKEVIPKTAIGKIQRSQLSKRFEEGEFNNIVKQIDLITENANTIPNWFYRQTWQQKNIQSNTLLTKEDSVLIFLDSSGLGDFLSKQLESFSDCCICVESGSDFIQLSSHRYRLKPSNKEHYELLLKSLAASNVVIKQILHCWMYNNIAQEISSLEALEQAQDKGIYSLLFLVQALAKFQGIESAVRLFCISSHTQSITSTDIIAYEKSPVLGFIKTIAQEMPWITSRHIDLSVDSIEINGAKILQELQGLSREQEIAYRQHKRWISCLEKAELSENNKRPLPFRNKGFYLISGGLGGIGVEIAKYLLKNYQTRLLLVGKTILPERSTWQLHLEQSTPIAKRIQSYQMLEKLGGEISYQAVDICDLAQLQTVVRGIECQWGQKLDGVFHLAGIYQERLLIDETHESLTATLKPKVWGTWVLHQLIKDQPHALFVSFSSLASFFGGAMIGGYTAANCFLDSFTDYQRSQGLLHSYCFAWSTWDRVGISQNSQMKGVSSIRGYYEISVQQGLYSLLASLHQGFAKLLIGLDGSNQNLGRYIKAKTCELQKLTAYYTASPNTTLTNQLSKPLICDRFGTSVTCNFVSIERIPLTDTGEIDREQLRNLVNDNNRKTNHKTAPRTEIEKQIADIWKEILNISQVNIYDNFFELGGNSLSAMQVIARLNDTFSVELPIYKLFESPTVAKLSELIATTDKADLVTDFAERLAIPQKTELSRLFSSSPLIAMKPSGSRPPLFLGHLVDGNIITYSELLRHITPEQPVYGLQAVSQDSQPQPLTRIEDMAAFYLKAIQTLQPQGPYSFAGWSFGGLIAFEMARQFRALGQKVSFLGLLDTFHPSLLQSILKLDVEDNAELYTELLVDKFGYDPTQTLEYLKQLKPNQQLLYVMEQAKQGNLIPSNFGREETDFMLQIYKGNMKALQNYVPKIYPGKITFFQAMERVESYPQDSTLIWKELATKGLEVHRVPGNHDRMVYEPHAQILARQLCKCLEKTQKNHGVQLI